MSPPNYRMADRCCANCDEGHGHMSDMGWYCSWHTDAHVSMHCVCDDWRPKEDA